MRSAFLAFVLALLIAPAAQAATPFALGPGEDPGLAVDAAGTAYIAWNGTESTGTRSLHFCRLPRGATTCQGAATLTEAPFFTLYRPFVTVSGSTVRVVQTRYGFLTGEFTRVYCSPPPTGTRSTPARWSAASRSRRPWRARATRSRRSASRPPAAGSSRACRRPRTARRARTVGHAPYDGAVGLTPQGRLITVFNDAGDSELRLQSGAGDPNDAATWGPPVSIGTQYYAKLAGGPAGLFLLGQNADRDLTVRRFTGTTFGAPARAGTGNEAPHGRLARRTAAAACTPSSPPSRPRPGRAQLRRLRRRRQLAVERPDTQQRRRGDGHPRRHRAGRHGHLPCERPRQAGCSPGRCGRLRAGVRQTVVVKRISGRRLRRPGRRRSSTSAVGASVDVDAGTDGSRELSARASQAPLPEQFRSRGRGGSPSSAQ